MVDEQVEAEYKENYAQDNTTPEGDVGPEEVQTEGNTFDSQMDFQESLIKFH